MARHDLELSDGVALLLVVLRAHGEQQRRGGLQFLQHLQLDERAVRASVRVHPRGGDLRDEGAPRIRAVLEDG